MEPLFCVTFSGNTNRAGLYLVRGLPSTCFIGSLDYLPGAPLLPLRVKYHLYTVTLKPILPSQTSLELLSQGCLPNEHLHLEDP